MANSEYRELLQTLSERATVARTVALWLIYIFAGSMLCSYGLVIYVVWKSYKSIADVATIKDAAIILTTTSSIFSPLLAFILGYYFNQAKHDADQLERTASAFAASAPAPIPASSVAPASQNSKTGTMTKKVLRRRKG